MRQLVVIHGGDAFDSYVNYIEHLKAIEVKLEDFDRKGWKPWLFTELGDAYQIFPLRMPNASNATYLEWKIWFQKYLPFLEDGVVLLGHSLGGIFLAKYLSENEVPVSVKATILISPPFDTDSEAGSLGDFVLPDSLDGLAQRGGEIHIFHSEDDQVVPYTEVDKYKTHLPSATIHRFKDRGHFVNETFPEALELIRSLG